MYAIFLLLVFAIRDRSSSLAYKLGCLLAGGEVQPELPSSVSRIPE